MASIIYSGQTFTLPDEVNVDVLADVILDTYAKGGHSWITIGPADAREQNMRLLVGPGIPVAILND